MVSVKVKEFNVNIYSKYTPVESREDFILLNTCYSIVTPAFIKMPFHFNLKYGNNAIQSLNQTQWLTKTLLWKYCKIFLILNHLHSLDNLYQYQQECGHFQRTILLLKSHKYTNKSSCDGGRCSGHLLPPNIFQKNLLLCVVRKNESFCDQQWALCFQWVKRSIQSYPELRLNSWRFRPADILNCHHSTKLWDFLQVMALQQHDTTAQSPYNYCCCCHQFAYKHSSLCISFKLLCYNLLHLFYVTVLQSVIKWILNCLQLIPYCFGAIKI
jgi:hypothetical protein